MISNPKDHKGTNTSQEGISRLYEEYKNQIYGFAFKNLKSSDRSHDIVQEVFTVLCQKDLSQVDNIRSYIFQITQNKVVDAFRHRARNNKLRAEMWAFISEKQGTADQSLVEKDYFRHLEEAKALLTPQQRLIFDLSRTEGLSHQKIADQLNLSPSTVKNHMVSALKTMREYLHTNTDVVISVVLAVVMI